MKIITLFVQALLLSTLCAKAYAESPPLELETTVIKGNKEVPQILYMVPWQETKNRSKKAKQKLVLHSLFGDLFDPVLPDTTRLSKPEN